MYEDSEKEDFEEGCFMEEELLFRNWDLTEEDIQFRDWLVQTRPRMALVNPVRLADLLAGEQTLRCVFQGRKAVSISCKMDVFASATGVLRVVGPRFVFLDPGRTLAAVRGADTVEFYPRRDNTLAMVASYQNLALPLDWNSGLGI